MNKKLICLVLSFLLLIEGNAQPADSSQNGMRDRLSRYLQGHDEFKRLTFALHEKEFVNLVKNGQNPRILFISCSDSRVVPEIILNAQPGDLFVIRTAGNFIPVYTSQIPADGVSATIQYAVDVLGVREIIVCGHSHCGAIKGLFEPLLAQKVPLV